MSDSRGQQFNRESLPNILDYLGPRDVTSFYLAQPYISERNSIYNFRNSPGVFASQSDSEGTMSLHGPPSATRMFNNAIVANTLRQRRQIFNERVQFLQRNLHLDPDPGEDI